METIALLGSITGLGLMAGIRLYATVLAVGLSVRFGLIELAPGMTHLAVLSSLPVLITAGVAHFLEFFADKIPWVDSLWDSIHTLRTVSAGANGRCQNWPADSLLRALCPGRH